jgi:hypothetical protein
MKILLASAPILFAAMLLGTAARADVAPPETEPCVGKAAGAACAYNGAGTCQSQTCLSPSAGGYACLECITSTNTNTTTNTNTVTATNTNTDGGTPPSKDDGACSIAKQATAKRVAPWLLAGAFSLLFLFGRRRRQS